MIKVNSDDNTYVLKCYPYIKKGNFSTNYIVLPNVILDDSTIKNKSYIRSYLRYRNDIIIENKEKLNDTEYVIEEKNYTTNQYGLKGRSIMDINSFTDFFYSKKFFTRYDNNLKEILRTLFSKYNEFSFEYGKIVEISLFKNFSIKTIEYYDDEVAVATNTFIEQKDKYNKENKNSISKLNKERKNYYKTLENIPSQYISQFAINNNIINISIENEGLLNSLHLNLEKELKSFGIFLSEKMDFFENKGVSENETLGGNFNLLLENYLKQNKKIEMFIQKFDNKKNIPNDLVDLNTKLNLVRRLKKINPNLWNWYHLRVATIDNVMSGEIIQNLHQLEDSSLIRGSMNANYFQTKRLLEIYNNNLKFILSNHSKKYCVVNAIDNFNYNKKEISKQKLSTHNCQDSVVRVIRKKEFFDKKIDYSFCSKLNKYIDIRAGDNFILEEEDFKNELYMGSETLYLKFLKENKIDEYFNFLSYGESSIFSTKNDTPIPLRNGSSKNVLEIIPIKMAFYFNLKKSTGSEKLIFFEGGDNDYSICDGASYSTFKFLQKQSLKKLNINGIYLENFSLKDMFGFVINSIFIPEIKHVNKNLMKICYPDKSSKNSTISIRSTTKELFVKFLICRTGKDYFPPNKSYGWAEFDYVARSLHIIYKNKIRPFIESIEKKENIKIFEKIYEYQINEKFKGKRWYVDFPNIKWWIIFLECINISEATLINRYEIYAKEIKTFEEQEKKVNEVIDEIIKICFIKNSNSFFRNYVVLKNELKHLKLNHNNVYIIVTALFFDVQTVQIETHHGKYETLLSRKINQFGSVSDKNKLILAIPMINEAKEFISNFLGEKYIKRNRGKFERLKINESHKFFQEIQIVFIDYFQNIIRNDIICHKKGIQGFVTDTYSGEIEIPKIMSNEIVYKRHINFFLQ